MSKHELLNPIEYLLQVMNDPAVKMEDRLESPSCFSRTAIR